MSRINIIIAVAIAAITISLWWLVNRPEAEPAWPDVIQGFSFSPMQAHNDPLAGNLPTVEEIDADLALLLSAVRWHCCHELSLHGIRD